MFRLPIRLLLRRYAQRGRRSLRARWCQACGGPNLARAVGRRRGGFRRGPGRGLLPGAKPQRNLLLRLRQFLLHLIRVASWNINSVRMRIGHLMEWLRQGKPDVVLLQEIKCLTEGFPRLEVEDLGYNLAIVGQKTYNGVAILSRHPMTVEATRLPGDEKDEHARYVEALIEADGKVLRVASIYLPNGNPVDSDKFPYKLAFLDRLHDHAVKLLEYEE